MIWFWTALSCWCAVFWLRTLWLTLRAPQSGPFARYLSLEERLNRLLASVIIIALAPLWYPVCLIVGPRDEL